MRMREGEGRKERKKKKRKEERRKEEEKERREKKEREKREKRGGFSRREKREVVRKEGEKEKEAVKREAEREKREEEEKRRRNRGREREEGEETKEKKRRRRERRKRRGERGKEKEEAITIVIFSKQFATEDSSIVGTRSRISQNRVTGGGVGLPRARKGKFLKLCYHGGGRHYRGPSDKKGRLRRLRPNIRSGSRRWVGIFIPQALFIIIHRVQSCKPVAGRFTNMEGSTSHGPSTSQTSIELRHRRGHIEALRTNRREDPNQIPTVNVNHHGQVFGLHLIKLLTFLGSLARTLDTIPLNFDDWRKVPIYYKELAWKDILVGKVGGELDEQLADLRDDTSVQNEIFVQVMGPELHGRIHSAGVGVSPRYLGLTQRNL
ncbi:hypothetical protein NE237_004083 [Protea cynaroides]|uniref:Uncharacterized protein n=1 Tax=Protea cynaroides TaxID=273540 RepID=A0A9Q0KI86_9MAGN|nr:hypothetical protein NE237_004083 [Protea cynaroides]